MMDLGVMGKTLDNATARRVMEGRRRQRSYKLMESDVGYVGSGDEWDESRADEAAGILGALVDDLTARGKRIDAFNFDKNACVTIHKTLGSVDI